MTFYCIFGEGYSNRCQEFVIQGWVGSRLNEFWFGYLEFNKEDVCFGFTFDVDVQLQRFIRDLASFYYKIGILLGDVVENKLDVGFVFTEYVEMRKKQWEYSTVVVVLFWER